MAELRVLRSEELSEKQRAAVAALAGQMVKVRETFDLMEVLCHGPSRELNVARTKLDELQMWATAHILRIVPA